MATQPAAPKHAPRRRPAPVPGNAADREAAVTAISRQLAGSVYRIEQAELREYLTLERQVVEAQARMAEIEARVALAYEHGAEVEEGPAGTVLDYAEVRASVQWKEVVREKMGDAFVKSLEMKSKVETAGKLGKSSIKIFWREGVVR